MSPSGHVWWPLGIGFGVRLASSAAGRAICGSQAARYYADTAGRRVSIEYALIRDINDQGPLTKVVLGVVGVCRSRLILLHLAPPAPTPGRLSHYKWPPTHLTAVAAKSRSALLRHLRLS